jgi:branched-chain amino acid transport system substrate-binding protein
MDKTKIGWGLGLLVLAHVMGHDPAWAQKGPIKIGFMAPLTGGAAQVGKDMVDGLTMYLDEAGNQIAARKVELIVEDSQGRPEVALTKLRKFVDGDKVNIVMGEAFAHIGLALAAKADEIKLPMIFPVVAADDLTQRKRANWVVRTGWASSQPSHPFGEWVAKSLGYKRVATLASDYAFEWEVVGGFQKTFEETGDQIIQKLWMPLGTADLAPYLAQIRRDADALFALPVAATALRFPKQYQEAGLKARLPVIGGGVIVDESFLPQFGDEALGIITPLM